MATAWTDVSPANVTAIGTSEKFSTAVSAGGNERLSGDVKLTTHGTDSVDVTVYESNDGGTTWAEALTFQIAAGDTDAHDLGLGLTAENIRVGLVASGSTDTPDASFRIKKTPLNSA